MIQRSLEPHYTPFKLVFIMYLAALAVHSYYSQGLMEEIKPPNLVPEMKANSRYLRQVNIESDIGATGVLLTSTSQQFIAMQTVPEWVTKVKKKI